MKRDGVIIVGKEPDSFEKLYESMKKVILEDVRGIIIEELSTTPMIYRAYLAGFFDGQGYLHVKLKPDKKKRIKFNAVFFQSCSKKEKFFLEEIVKMLEKLSIRASIYELKRKKGKKPEYQIYITRINDTVKFLKLIEPFLILKKQFVREALEKYEKYRR